MNKLHTINAEDLQNRTYETDALSGGRAHSRGAAHPRRRTENRQVVAGVVALLISEFSHHRDERFERVQPRVCDFASIDLGTNTLHQGIDFINLVLVIHRPSHD